MDDFAQNLKVLFPTLVTTITKGNRKTQIHRIPKEDKEVLRIETIEDGNRKSIQKRRIDGNTIYAEQTISDENITKTTQIVIKNGITVKKFREFTKIGSNPKSIYSKKITYECEGRTLNKISSIEYISTKNGYIETDRSCIIRCPYNDTSIIIKYSSYRIRTEKPWIECVAKFDYDDIDNNSAVLPDYTILPLYKANSVEYNWAQKVLKEKQEEYEALVSYKER